jgi:6-phosphogluconolactonase
LKNPLLFFILALTFPLKGQSPKEILYVGTFSVRGSEGIYVFEFDRNDASVKLIQTVSGPESPTFLEIHPSGKFLYSVNRGGVHGASNAGSIHGYSIDPVSGKLTAINSKSSFGLGPCHVAIEREGKFAYVSHYNEGTLAVYSLLKDGSIGVLVDSIRYLGKGPNLERQQSPHIHSATFSPNNRFVVVADLGTDKVYNYQVEGANGKLVPASTPFVQVAGGSGPRHLSFHPNGNYFYLVEEITSTLGAAFFDARSGEMKIMQDQTPTLPIGFDKSNTGADIHASPDGKFLYLSNRGHNSLAIFAISKAGKLTLVGHESTQGKTPRNFMITPDGDLLFVAHQDSDNVIIFKRNKKTGLLKSIGSISLPSPVCIKMLVR